MATSAATLAALDWNELTARLAAAADSPAGRALCLALPLAADARDARKRMAAVAELATILRTGEPPPRLEAPQIDAALASAEKLVVLGADELRPVGVLVGLAEQARRFFLRDWPVPAPEVAALARDLDPPLSLARAIDDTFDAAGEIRDSASPELERLRAERNGLQERARGAIEELMRVDEYRSVMQDQFFTIRAERYVLPLKASAKSLGLGIVHDTSRTGETVFVEPTALVAVNNRLKVTELDIRRESRRILEALTADVAALAEPLRRTAAVLAALDVRLAGARLGLAYGGSAIDIVDAPIVELREARHPLLALSHAAAADVVANDIALGGQQPPILVVSGPNAGGKTVLMKTVGLAALMARAGLLVAADPRSRVGFFDDVRADIGDRQSVMGDLSTFSGHLANVAEILRPSAGPAPALVLLDELMAGTNPDQGAALARATAEALASRNALAVITTHYDSLKALGESDAHFANAGMQYDLAELRPTFRLVIGAPGRSYAFDIAARMGLPAPLLERARALAGSSSVGLEALLARLEAREAALVAEAERLAAAEAEAAAAAEAQRQAAAALVARERELRLNARAAADAAIAEARAALKAIVRQAQEAGTGRAAEAARGEIDRVAAGVHDSLPAREVAAPPAAEAWKPGARVFVERLGAEGVLAEVPDGRGRARVTVGKMTLDVAVDELRPSAAPAQRVERARRAEARAETGQAAAGGSGGEDSLALVSPGSGRTLDLRGQSGDEALAALDAFLDRAALSGETHIVVVHGHGTGALRKRVRAHLDESPYVARWAPGTPRQGGDGASIAELR